METKAIVEAIQAYLSQSGHDSIELKTAMFDMDGVLFDSMRNHAYSWHETMKHFGMYLSQKEAYMHEGRTGAGTINIVSKRDRGREATEEEIKEIYSYKSHLFSTCPTAQPMTGAYELLKKVKSSGIVPMVVTGSGQRNLLDRISKQFPDIFPKEMMVTAFDVKYGKPNPEPYLMGLQKASAFLKGGQVQPNNSIVIENAPLGIEAGVASGCFTIAVNTGPLADEVLMERGAHLLFHSIQEMCEWWGKLFVALRTTHKA